jgi:hypothetical protein
MMLLKNDIQTNPHLSNQHSLISTLVILFVHTYFVLSIAIFVFFTVQLKAVSRLFL